MEPRYFCSQNIQRLGEFAKWPGTAPRIPWHVDLSGYRGNLTVAQLIEAFQRACRWWEEAAELTLPMVSSAAEALIRMHFAGIDGPSGILAWSELADNTQRPKTQRYDSGEIWTIEWFISAVVAHEVGHAIGLEHDAQGQETLMGPMIRENVRKPTARDIQRLLNLGYKARTTPLPDPNPQPGEPPAEYTIRFKKQMAAGQYDGFALGSKMEVGDYLTTHIDPTPPQ